MPRRVQCNPAKVLGNFFVLFVIMVIWSLYFPTMNTLLPLWQTSNYWWMYTGVFNFFLWMLIWSFIQAMTTDPGEVPPYWGFYMGDPEYKRRRYCLMCHVFKPERCHHCSACNRCVLNMDHHCPWINNCVGFYNRKYFFLLLIYVIIVCCFVAWGLHSRAIDTAFAIYETQ